MLEMHEITNKSLKINYMPDNLIEEILQNGRTILTTFAGTVPLMREFAQDWALVDRKSTEVTNILLNKLIPLFKRYEPRIRINSLRVELKEGEETTGNFYIILEVEVIV